MALTFKSSRREELVMIQREPDGRQRVARATMSDYNDRHWEVELQHPSGQSWSGVCTGSKIDVGLGLTKLLADHEMEWIQDKSRSDRPPQSQHRDHNVRVADDGRDIAPTIMPRR
jgi:hypothetical protein